MAEPLTLMAVHAHPDDEAIGTGGILARAAAEGIRTVLVTCTGGEVGEINPNTGATPETLGEIRKRELQDACDILGVSHLEMLGYRDSGMMGTADNHHPESFQQADLTKAIARMVSLVRKYRPSVIVTYDENGFYGHPDHINAHRVAVGAYHRAGDAGLVDGLEPYTPQKLYYTAIATSQFKEFGKRLRELGIAGPGGRPIDEPESDAVQAEPVEPDMPWGVPDALITTVVDVAAHAGQKRRALWAHATQMGPDVFFAKLPEPLFEQMFGLEQFRLQQARVDIALPETDLFAGLR
jgi:N-acetyl-1-D-myo-inositol-2-amino-2-deoxy-alpha-D-glucopyranoside deacetylase